MIAVGATGKRRAPCPVQTARGTSHQCDMQPGSMAEPRAAATAVVAAMLVSRVWVETDSRKVGRVKQGDSVSPNAPSMSKLHTDAQPPLMDVKLARRTTKLSPALAFVMSPTNLLLRWTAGWHEMRGTGCSSSGGSEEGSTLVECWSFGSFRLHAKSEEFCAGAVNLELLLPLHTLMAPALFLPATTRAAVPRYAGVVNEELHLALHTHVAPPLFYLSHRGLPCHPTL
ncbi:unnamed protein product [Closterium sp. Yama58-4]|nr:unnamed protein product [Closterium sp. Yama58-4]